MKCDFQHSRLGLCCKNLYHAFHNMVLRGRWKHNTCFRLCCCSVQNAQCWAVSITGNRLDAMSFLKTHCLPFSNPKHKVWRVPSILFYAPRRREFLADDACLWGMLLAEIKSRANLAIIRMNHKTSLLWVSFWLQAMTSCSYVHWTDATHVPIFQVVGNVGSILIFLF